MIKLNCLKMTDIKIIEEKIRSGEYKTKENTILKSAIWEKILNIVDKNEDVIKNYVICQVCKNVYKYSSHKLGTSALLRHKCSSSTQCNSIASYFPSVNKTIEISTNHKQMVLRSACEFVVKDLRPMEALSGHGLIALANAFIKIGAQYKNANMDASKILPHPTTVSRRISKLSEECHHKMLLRNVLLKVGGAVTLDQWTDDYHKLNYMGSTFHYIQNDKIVSRILCTQPITSSEKKTGEFIRMEITNNFKKFEIEDHMNDIVYVTDRGANIVKALNSYTRLNCFAHFLNNTSQFCVDKDATENVYEILENSKKLVTFFKCSGKQSKLTTTLKQSNTTRWNFHLIMLNSILENFDNVYVILKDENQLNRLNIEKK